MPHTRYAYTKTPASQPASEGMLPASNPSNYGNATSKVINLNNNNWLGDSVVFTVDSAWRYVVHVRNTHNGPSSIHIDDVRVYGKNTASYLLCGSGGEGYRFGFGGQEKENDISGLEGGHLSYQYRIHDARLGRFLSVDPLAPEYPWNSSYAFAENRVIQCIDMEGAEAVEVNDDKITFTLFYVAFEEGEGAISNITTFSEIYNKISDNISFQYYVSEDIVMKAENGSESNIKAGFYDVQFKISVKQYKNVDEFFQGPEYDNPEYSGRIVFDKFTSHGETYTIDKNNPDEFAKTISFYKDKEKKHAIPESNGIIFPSSYFSLIPEKNDFRFYNSLLHETFMHDLGQDHVEGKYDGGAGQRAHKEIMNKLNLQEFENILKRSDKIRNIKVSEE